MQRDWGVEILLRKLHFCEVVSTDILSETIFFHQDDYESFFDTDDRDADEYIIDCPDDYYRYAIEVIRIKTNVSI